MTDFLDGVTWFRHSSIRIRRGGVEIHVDPWGVTEKGEVGLHPPHPSSLRQLLGRGHRQGQGTRHRGGGTRQHAKTVGGCRPPPQAGRPDPAWTGSTSSPSPAHNRNRKFHPADSGWLGYVFSLDQRDLLPPGHTDPLDSMAGIRCDVALIPCCSDYTMGAEEAVGVAEICGASILVPLHWDDSPDGPGGGAEDGGAFLRQGRTLERTT